MSYEDLNKSTFAFAMHNFCTWILTGLIVIFFCVLLKRMYKYVFRYRVYKYHVYIPVVLKCFVYDCVICTFAYYVESVCAFV